MKIFVTGATGFIGRALVLRLRRDGHTIVAWVRSLPRARTLLGGEATLVDAAGGAGALAAALEGCDGVVNLAGAPIIGRRWTAAYRHCILTSRVGTTDALVAALAGLTRRPAVMVSASAVGIYGAQRGGTLLGEAARQGDDFLAEVCRRWELAARAAEPLGVRVVLPRIGIVLGHEGGALAAMLPIFQASLGGPLGDGAQYMPWIHLHDLVDALATALVDGRYHGAYNAVAPAPAQNSALTAKLARALGVAAPLRVPALALRAALGAAAGAVLAGQRAVPQRLQDAGFVFRYPGLAQALTHLLPRDAVRLAPRDADAPPPLAPSHPYLAARRPDQLLRAVTRLSRPLPEVFDFFCRAENLGLMTPSAMALTIAGAPPAAMHAGLGIDYTLRLGPLPLRWRTRITHWQPPTCFVDAQERGPYRAWWHEHHFTGEGDGTRMEDRVFYRLPLGPLGDIAHAVQVRAQLQRIFWYRASAISLRFGVTE